MDGLYESFTALPKRLLVFRAFAFASVRLSIGLPVAPCQFFFAANSARANDRDPRGNGDGPAGVGCPWC